MKPTFKPSASGRYCSVVLPYVRGYLGCLVGLGSGVRGWEKGKGNRMGGVKQKKKGLLG